MVKLRNKKTGEIIDVKDALTDSDDYPNHYVINDEWEGYEEPKISYFINWFGEVSELSGLISDREIEKLKEVGNYFESEDEARKAAEKLKAWNRLKDKGLSFRHWKEAPLRSHSSCIAITGNMSCDEESRKDLDLLFGVEK